jgi:hypothetical protein
MATKTEQEGGKDQTPRPPPARKEAREDGLQTVELRVLTKRLKEVFVPHAELEAFLEKQASSNMRVIVIDGDAGSGRLACAAWLGGKLNNFERVMRLHEETVSQYDLGALARSRLLEEDTVYIIEEAFKSGINEDLIPDLQLAALNEQLNRLDSWLILTTNGGSAKWSHKLIGWFSIPKAGPDFLEEVLARHLQWERAGGMELPSEIERAARELVRTRFSDPGISLHTAPQVYRFTRNLAASLPLPSPVAELKRELDRLAAEVADDSRPRQAWFAALSANAQFLALLAGAFEGVGRSDLEDIYHTQVQRVRGEEPGLFHDPRQRGFEELFREIQVESTDSGLHFTSASCRREVLRQMGFRHHLLWEVLESVQEWMNALAGPRQWKERAVLGCAVARLGIHRPEKLKPLLLRLAASEDAMIASIPGDILRGVCLLDEPRHDFVCDLLSEWVRPDEEGAEAPAADEAARLWAAAEAIQRVYVELAEREKLDPVKQRRLTRVLRRLADILEGIARSRTRYLHLRAEKWAQEGLEVARARKWAQEEIDNVLASAVSAMFRTHPREMVVVLLKWLGALPPVFSEKPTEPEGAAPDTKDEQGKETTPPGELEEKKVPVAAQVTRAASDEQGDRDEATVAGLITRRLFEEHRGAENLSLERRDALLELIGPVLQSDRGVVNGILEILREWVRPGAVVPGGTKAAEEAVEEMRKEWRLAILRALLSACNLMSEGQRRGLRRGLMTLWLTSPEAEVRAIAQAVVCRARLLEGPPTDVPGGVWGGIHVDATAQGRGNDTSYRLVQELFELLRPHVDLWVGQLGNREEFCGRGEFFDADAVPSRPHGLRVLTPSLERLAVDEAEPAAFHVAVHWGELEDQEEALEAAGQTPVHSIQVQGIQESETGPFAGLFRLLGFPPGWVSAANESVFETLLFRVEEAVGPHLSRRLAERAAEQWWELLAPLEHLAGLPPEAQDRRAEVESFLHFVANRLEHPESPVLPAGAGRGRLNPDPVRAGLGAVQWLAQENLAATVRFLESWMKGKAGARANLATAAAIMLLRIQHERMLPTAGPQAGSVPALEPYAALLTFGPPLMRRRSRLGVDGFLKALRHWCTDPGWAAALLEETRRPKSKLLAMCAAAHWWQRLGMSDTLREWVGAPLASLNEKQVPDAVHALSLRLRYDLALRARFWTEEAPVFPVPLEPCGLVVLCLDAADSDGRTSVEALVGDLYDRWERERLPGLKHYLFIQAGRRAPLAVSRELAQRETFAAELAPVPTLAPVFDGLAPWMVKLVVVIANRPLVDLEDIMEENPWLAQDAKLKLFWIKSALRPRPKNIAGVQWEEFEPKTDEPKIRERLKPYFQESRP